MTQIFQNYIKTVLFVISKIRIVYFIHYLAFSAIVLIEFLKKIAIKILIVINYNGSIVQWGQFKLCGYGKQTLFYSIIPILHNSCS